MNKNLEYFAIEEEKMENVIGGGSWHWGEGWGEPGYWGCTPVQPDDNKNPEKKEQPLRFIG